MKVLSFFGGIECGLVALKKLGIQPTEYYSSEIDPYPIKITTENHPEVVHIGSITNVKYEIGTLQWVGGEAQTEIDLMIGGSPCQDLSIAKAGGKGLNGEKSGLFFEYMRLLEEVKPKYFLLENVASMKSADRDEITRIIGVEPIMINSALVSAQNRKRLYWTNIPGVQIPEDKGIVLKDILEDIPMNDEQWKPLDKKYITDKGGEKLREKTKNSGEEVLGVFSIYNQKLQTEKTTTLGTNSHCQTAKTGQIVLGVYQKPRGKNQGGIVQNGEKSPTINASRFQDNNYILGQFRRTNLRIHSEQEKSCTLTANMGTGGNNVPIILQDIEHEYYWRKLTPTECERLQTLPDGYTNHVSATRRYKAIGNGWTVDVIKHILSYIK